MKLLKKNVLVLENRTEVNKSLALLVQDAGAIARPAFDLVQAKDVLERHACAAAIIDLNLTDNSDTEDDTNNRDGKEVIPLLTKLGEYTSTIVITAFWRDSHVLRQVFRLGVDDVLFKSQDTQEEKIDRIRAALAKWEWPSLSSSPDQYGGNDVLGHTSPGMFPRPLWTDKCAAVLDSVRTRNHALQSNWVFDLMQTACRGLFPWTKSGVVSPGNKAVPAVIRDGFAMDETRGRVALTLWSRAIGEGVLLLVGPRANVESEVESGRRNGHVLECKLKDDQTTVFDTGPFVQGVHPQEFAVARLAIDVPRAWFASSLKT